MKIVPIWSFLVRIFQHAEWIRTDTPYLSVFSPNAGKYRPENSKYGYLSRSVDVRYFSLKKYIVDIWQGPKIQKQIQVLCQGLIFNKVARLRLWHRFFPVSFVKFLRITFFYRTPLEDCFYKYTSIPAGIYLFKRNDRNTRTRSEICSKLTIKTRGRAGVYIVKFEHISYLAL